MRRLGDDGARRLARARKAGVEGLEGRSLLSGATVGDFDGDHKTDLAIYDQTGAAFYERNSSTNGATALNNGAPVYMGDPNHVNVPVVADYDGDGKADLAIYDSSVAAFYIRAPIIANGKSVNTGGPIYMGNPSHLNVPFAADFDGDGKADIGIYDETVGAFYVRYSSTGYMTALNGGQPSYMGDPSHVIIPVVGDFDGDGKADLAIYDETAAAFYERNSSTGFATALNGGNPVFMGDPSHQNVPVVGDFDGDGKADLAIFDATAAAFYVRYSKTNYLTALNGGQPTYMGSPNHDDFPLIGDYDGDGKADLAIYDENTGSFYERNSSTNFATALNGGQAIQMGDPIHGDIPLTTSLYNPGRHTFVNASARTASSRIVVQGAPARVVADPTTVPTPSRAAAIYGLLS